MTAKRLGALLLAAALVVAALLIRSALDDDSGEAATDGTPPPNSRYTLVCSTEFTAVCDSLDAADIEVTVEAAGTTLSRLSRTGAMLPDAWLTLDPFPGMLDDLRSLGGANLPRVVVSSQVLAVTDPALAVKVERLDDFASGCAGQPLWGCAADHAGQPWTAIAPNTSLAGDIEVGMRDPVEQAVGLVEFANAVAGHYNTADLDARPWVDDSAAFNGWLRTFADNVHLVSPPPTPLSTLLTRALVNIASTTRAEADGTPGNTESFEALDPTPSVRVLATYAVIGEPNDSLSAQLNEALLAQGWLAPAADQAQHTPSTFIALRQQWETTT